MLRLKVNHVSKKGSPEKLLKVDVKAITDDISYAAKWQNLVSFSSFKGIFQRNLEIH